KKKNLVEILDFIYFWSLNLVQKKVAYQSNTKSKDTTSSWYNKLCMLSGKIIRSEQSNEKIGGIGHIVQIDESKFSKRKYNVGRTVRSPWIVGGIDLNTKRYFLARLYLEIQELLQI
ncbi:hypothetical protein H311_00709, partial [Anncaliia algerae PRA109]